MQAEGREDKPQLDPLRKKESHVTMVKGEVRS